MSWRDRRGRSFANRKALRDGELPALRKTAPSDGRESEYPGLLRTRYGRTEGAGLTRARRRRSGCRHWTSCTGFAAHPSALASDLEDPDGVGDAFEGVLAPVGEGDAGGGAGEGADGVGDEDLAGFGESHDPGGDVDGAAVDVVALAQYVAGMEAEVELEAGALGGGVAAQGAFDRLAGGGEDGEEAVAEERALDGRAAA